MKNITKGWIGVDLDGTLAEYTGWVNETHIGPPVPAMLTRVKDWLAEGKTVKIFTARAYRYQEYLNLAVDREAEEDITPRRKAYLAYHHVREAIHAWCVANGLPRLEITCCKDYGMIELWDDRCVQVAFNTGMPVELLTNE